MTSITATSNFYHMAPKLTTNNSDTHTFPWMGTTLVTDKPKRFPSELTDAKTWQLHHTDAQGLSDHIGSGYTWMPAILKDDAIKKNDESCKALYSLAVDIDNGKSIVFSLDAAREHPFVKAHAALVQETPSSTKQQPRFRIVFPLLNPLYTIENVNIAYQYLHTLVPGCDPSCKDPQRIFYGAKGTVPYFLSLTNTLPDNFLELAKADNKKRVKAQQARERRAFNVFKTKFDGVMNDYELICSMSSFFPHRRKGENTYDDCFRVLCGLVNVLGEAEAIRIAEASPLASDKSQDWDVPSKVQSILRTKPQRSIGMGTLVWYAKHQGWKPPGIAKKNVPPITRFSESHVASYASSSTSMEVDLEDNASEEAPNPWGAPQVRGNALFHNRQIISNFRLEVLCQVEPPRDDPSLGGAYLVKVYPTNSPPFEGLVSNKDQGSVKDLLTKLSQFPGSAALIFSGDRKQLISHLGQQAAAMGATTIRLANRFGKQSDGAWVFPEPAPEFQAEHWRFIGRNNDIAPAHYHGFKPQATGALRDFLLKLRKIVTERYFNQVLFMLGWTLAALHRTEVEEVFHQFPLVNAYGENGSGKSYAASICAGLLGQTLVMPETYAHLLNLMDSALNYPLFFDDPAPEQKRGIMRFDFSDLTRRAFQGTSSGNSLDRGRRATRPLAILSNYEVPTDISGQLRILSLPFSRADRPDITISPTSLNAEFSNLSSSFLEFVSVPIDLTQVDIYAIPDTFMDKRTCVSVSIVHYFCSTLLAFLDIPSAAESLDAYIFETVTASQKDSQDSLNQLDMTDDLLSLKLSANKIGLWCIRYMQQDDQQTFVTIGITTLKELIKASDLPIEYSSLIQQIELEANTSIKKGTVRYVKNEQIWTDYQRRSVTDQPVSVPIYDSVINSIFIPSHLLPITFDRLQNLIP